MYKLSFKLHFYVVFAPQPLRAVGVLFSFKLHFYVVFTPQPLRAVGVLFSPMVSGWAGGGKSLSGLYLRNCKVQEVDTW